MDTAGGDSPKARASRAVGGVARRSSAPGPAWSHPTEALWLFLRGVTVRTACKVAVVVGTLLSAVNQGDVIAAGGATWGTWLRVAFNYLVPFMVSSIGFPSACRDQEVRRRPPGW